MIHVKRVYEKPSRGDGERILVDALWPRGLTKEKARVDLWLKDVAPSTSLRKWFNHQPAKWNGFKHRYYTELDDKPDLLMEKANKGTVTLLYGAKEERFNNAVALREYLEEKLYRKEIIMA
jgi:uncharacterized protein YeaO (DUF488 family)